MIALTAVAANLQAQNSQQILSEQKTESKTEKPTGDIQRFLEIIKDDQKRQKLIDRLEADGSASPPGEMQDAAANEDASLSDALLAEVAQTGQDAAELIEHTFTSPAALLTLAKRVGLTLLLIFVVYILWRLVKRYIITHMRSAWPLKILIAVFLGLAAVLSLLFVWGFDVYELLGSKPGRTISTSLITIIFVVAIAYAAWEFLNRILYKQEARIKAEEVWERRLQTMLPLIRSALLMVISVITILVVLAELGINIAPLLAGAGIVGLAIGFGAQTLVKDLLTGFFVLLENTINVGDWVILGGHDGQVEGLSIRHVMVRDIYGNLHTVPWSSVVTITNQTREFGYAVVEVGFAYRENIDEVISVVKRVADEMRQDEAINEGILSELQILGLIELGDSAVVVRTRFKTQPFLRWRLERDFRRRIKNRFDELGIEIPYPHQTIYFGENKQGRAAPARVHIQGSSVSE